MHLPFFSYLILVLGSLPPARATRVFKYNPSSHKYEEKIVRDITSNKNEFQEEESRLLQTISQNLQKINHINRAFRQKPVYQGQAQYIGASKIPSMIAPFVFDESAIQHSMRFRPIRPESNFRSYFEGFHLQIERLRREGSLKHFRGLLSLIGREESTSEDAFLVIYLRQVVKLFSLLSLLPDNKYKEVFRFALLQMDPIAEMSRLLGTGTDKMKFAPVDGFEIRGPKDDPESAEKTLRSPRDVFRDLADVLRALETKKSTDKNWKRIVKNLVDIKNHNDVSFFELAKKRSLLKRHRVDGREVNYAFMIDNSETMSVEADIMGAQLRAWWDKNRMLMQQEMGESPWDLTEPEDTDLTLGCYLDESRKGSCLEDADKAIEEQLQLTDIEPSEALFEGISGISDDSLSQKSEKVPEKKAPATEELFSAEENSPELIKENDLMKISMLAVQDPKEFREEPNRLDDTYRGVVEDDITGRELRGYGVEEATLLRKYRTTNNSITFKMVGELARLVTPDKGDRNLKELILPQEIADLVGQANRNQKKKQKVNPIDKKKANLTHLDHACDLRRLFDEGKYEEEFPKCYWDFLDPRTKHLWGKIKENPLQYPLTPQMANIDEIAGLMDQKGTMDRATKEDFYRFMEAKLANDKRVKLRTNKFVLSEKYRQRLRAMEIVARSGKKVDEWRFEETPSFKSRLRTLMRSYQRSIDYWREAIKDIPFGSLGSKDYEGIVDKKLENWQLSFRARLTHNNRMKRERMRKFQNMRASRLMQTIVGGRVREGEQIIRPMRLDTAEVLKDFLEKPVGGSKARRLTQQSVRKMESEDEELKTDSKTSHNGMEEEFRESKQFPSGMDQWFPHDPSVPNPHRGELRKSNEPQEDSFLSKKDPGSQEEDPQNLLSSDLGFPQIYKESSSPGTENMQKFDSQSPFEGFPGWSKKPKVNPSVNEAPAFWHHLGYQAAPLKSIQETPESPTETEGTEITKVKENEKEKFEFEKPYRLENKNLGVAAIRGTPVGDAANFKIFERGGVGSLGYNSVPIGQQKPRLFQVQFPIYRTTDPLEGTGQEGKNVGKNPNQIFASNLGSELTKAPNTQAGGGVPLNTHPDRLNNILEPQTKIIGVLGSEMYGQDRSGDVSMADPSDSDSSRPVKLVSVAPNFETVALGAQVLRPSNQDGGEVNPIIGTQATESNELNRAPFQFTEPDSIFEGPILAKKTADNHQARLESMALKQLTDNLKEAAAEAERLTTEEQPLSFLETFYYKGTLGTTTFVFEPQRMHSGRRPQHRNLVWRSTKDLYNSVVFPLVDQRRSKPVSDK